MRNALTIAGSDCSGGAGIQGDLKTFAAHGIYGMSVITAITAQNTQGITHIQPCHVETVQEQLLALFTDISIHSIKLGMLYNSPIIKTIANILSNHVDIPMVLDPVMISSSNKRLLEEDAITSMVDNLFPLTYLITPNVPEAEHLTDTKIKNIIDMERACEKLVALGAKSVLLKGGHINEDASTTFDLLYHGTEFTKFEHGRLTTKHTHGTGCTLSSAITANLSKGYPLKIAVGKGIDYVQKAFAQGFPLGKGIGPANHLYFLKDSK